MPAPRALPLRALAALYFLVTTSVSAQTPESVVLRVARVIDGPGRTLRNQDATVQGGRIAAMRASKQRLHEDRDGDTPEVSTLQRAGNAWATMTPEELNAACGESTAQGLRSVVHAHSAEAEKGIGLAAKRPTLIATDGAPVAQIEASQRVSFVMKDGRVYRNDGARK